MYTSVFNAYSKFFQLEDVNWRLHLQLAQENKAQLKTPSAVFEFNIKDETSEVKV